MANNVFNTIAALLSGGVVPMTTQQANEVLVPPVPAASPDIVVQGANQGMAAPPVQRTGGGLREVPRDESFKAPERKGLFGVKGTLRDILGTLGDAFLVQSGNKAIYAPTREQEKLSDAYLESYGLNPEEGYQRIGVENPEFAEKIRTRDEDRKVKMSQIEANQAYKNAQVENLRQKRIDYLRSRIGEKVPNVKTQQELDIWMQALRGQLPEDISFDDLMLSDQPTLDELKNYGIRADRAQGLEVQRGRLQETGRHNQATEGIAQTNAGIAARNATTAAGRAAESVRHNREQEAQGRERNEIYRSKGSGTRPRPAASTGGTPPSAKTRIARTPDGRRFEVGSDGKIIREIK